ncbi:MAG: HD domain-containing protein [Deltaproteobacteria bacterium]|nr:HD domain-containing protein [Deltaproteobacteria bacterium]
MAPNAESMLAGKGSFWMYSDEHAANLKRMVEVGLALSSESNIERLLELIVQEARHLARADAGSLYIVDPHRLVLDFVVLQNHSLGVRMGGATGLKPDLPSVPLYLASGEPNHSNVSAHAVHSKTRINIRDVYEAEDFDFSGPKRYDEMTGYRSQSMLVIPMQNHEGDIIGVLQLINAFDQESGRVTAFGRDLEELAASLASLAAVALTKTQLIKDLSELFHSFTRSIAAAIDAKSPYTAGHIKRVVELTRMIAAHIQDERTGPLAETSFTPDELEELTLAAWLHDVGKIVTPEHILDKSCKLASVEDRMEVIDLRLDLIRTLMEKDAQDDRLLNGSEEIDGRLAKEVAQLDEDREFIRECNRPSERMSDVALKRLRRIAGQRYRFGGAERPFLTDCELEFLSVPRGTLTGRERIKIEEHARTTIKVLNQLTFPKKFAKVPEIAGQHHEKLDGTGYPRHLRNGQICIQSRILAIADIFEALTARDRPYKEPMSLRDALEVMKGLVKDGKIDSDLYEIFVRRGVSVQYGREFLDPWQLNVEDRPTICDARELPWLEDLIPMGRSDKVFDEIALLTREMARMDLSLVERVYWDVERLFAGHYPGYRQSTTKYHDHEHTCAVALATIRLMHGYHVRGNRVEPADISKTLIASLFHDTGFIQAEDDVEGTGAKYTVGHEERSIALMRSYFERHGIAEHDAEDCASMISCTILNRSMDEYFFRDEKVRLFGSMLGTADILAQMADRMYLEKLLLLYREFEEAQLPGYGSDIDLLRRTEGFYQDIKKRRIQGELGGVDRFMRDHFRQRWGFDADLYELAVERNLQTLRSVLRDGEEEIRSRLRTAE